VSWDEHHSKSEKLASDAELAVRAGEMQRGEDLYRLAAEEETAALSGVAPSASRTLGITAVSAVALWYKGRDYTSAESLALRNLANGHLPEFSVTQLRTLLNMIWMASAAEKAGVKFVPGDVLVSIKGGEVIHGGAPLDLIVRKVEGIQAALYRTVELLLQLPFRKRGAPPADVQNMFRPWLFQAPAGSYQFAVRMQEPEQRALWEGQKPNVDALTATFFGVLRASATSPDVELPAIVPDREYRGAFLNLSRDLAPTGRSFERLEIRDASAPSRAAIVLGADTRQDLNAALRKARPPKPSVSTDEPATLRGTLRALHLDQDWLEIATDEPPPAGHIRVEEAGDALDDIVGPMVNRRVIVSTVRRGTKYLYRDIELEE
jgi:hypothetical protein